MPYFLLLVFSLFFLLEFCMRVNRRMLKTHLFNISYPCDCTVPAQWH